MSLVRAILGRFARFLVRIARRLDPSLAAAPYRATPEQMAALRVRYPAAPQHWLELVAQRAMVDDLPEPAETAASRGAEEPAFADRRRELSGNPQRDSVRRPRPRSVAQFNAAEGSAGRFKRVAASKPRGAARVRATAAFVTRRLRRPIADLLISDRLARSRPILNFNFHVPRPRQDERVETAERHDARPERPLVFPDMILPEERDQDAPFEPVRDDARDRTDPRWPDLRLHNEAPRHWPKSPAARGRPPPAFPVRDERWPDLPAVDDCGASSLAPTTDEAKLACEQVGGTWSA